MESFTHQILDCLNKGIPFALAVVMTHKGSTPRTSGTRMLVHADRQIHGTIGGGLLEARVMDTCIKMMSASQSEIREFALDSELKNGLDMVCGGHLSVWMESFVPPFEPSLIKVFSEAAAQEKAGRKAVMVSRVNRFTQSMGNSQKTGFFTEKCLVLPDGSVTGSLPIPKALFDAVCDNRYKSPAPVIVNQGLEEFIVEPGFACDTLFIFGAGHVGYQLAKMAFLTDFRTVVIDDREEFANPVRFENAHAVHVVNQFSKAFDALSIDRHSYIVILTRGHLHDQTVLEGALKTKAAYIGMIGSRRKRDQIYRNLADKGVPQKRLDAVYSPVGLDIGSETPAEIAVSIIGQIIQVRSRNK